MKTNKLTKSIFALLAVVMLGAVTVSAFANTGSDAISETFAFKRGEKRNDPNHQKREYFEDWFENRIDTREDYVDYSQLSDKPTNEEMMEFFKNYFMGESTSQSGRNKPHRSHKDERKADRFEDWFEDRIERHEHRVDFSELPEKPTDEEIVEFFKKYFMDENGTVTGNGQKRGGKCEPSSGDKNTTEQTPVTAEKAAPEGEVTSKTPQNVVTEETPAETQPTEEAPVETQPTEESVKDKA